LTGTLLKSGTDCAIRLTSKNSVAANVGFPVYVGT
jgi:hypothetical protein